MISFCIEKNSKFIEKDMMSIHCLNSLHCYMTPNKSFHRVTFLWDGRGVYFSMFIWSDCLNFCPAFLNTINEIYWSLYTLKLINMHGKKPFRIFVCLYFGACICVWKSIVLSPGFERLLINLENSTFIPLTDIYHKWTVLKLLRKIITEQVSLHVPNNKTAIHLVH